MSVSAIRGIAKWIARYPAYGRVQRRLARIRRQTALAPFQMSAPKRPAVQDAVEQREAVTPELLRVLEEVAANPAEFAERDDYAFTPITSSSPRMSVSSTSSQFAEYVMGPL
jgi:Protein of unknown function (DUF1186)